MLPTWKEALMLITQVSWQVLAVQTCMLLLLCILDLLVSLWTSTWICHMIRLWEALPLHVCHTNAHQCRHACTPRLQKEVALAQFWFFWVATTNFAQDMAWLVLAGSQTLQLKDNYRSTPQVLRGAEGVLRNILGTGAAAARLPLVPLRAGGPAIEAGPHCNHTFGYSLTAFTVTAPLVHVGAFSSRL